MNGLALGSTMGSLIDLPSAAIVLGGTILFTLLRCGWRESVLTVRTLAQSFGGERFQPDAARAELARQVESIRQDGLFRAEEYTGADEDFDEATDALLQQHSLAALLAAHGKHRARRQQTCETAVRVLLQAAELAPVCGMAGTLIALNRMRFDPAGGGMGGTDDMAGAIGMAVLTTLYGLLAANLLFAPLARVIERASAREEAERQKLVDWMADQVTQLCPAIGTRDRRKKAA